MRVSIKAPVSSPNLFESSLSRWVAFSGFARSAQTAHPSNWIQTYLETPRWTKPPGLIESWIVKGIIVIIQSMMLCFSRSVTSCAFSVFADLYVLRHALNKIQFSSVHASVGVIEWLSRTGCSWCFHISVQYGLLFEGARINAKWFHCELRGPVLLELRRHQKTNVSLNWPSGRGSPSPDERRGLLHSLQTGGREDNDNTIQAPTLQIERKSTALFQSGITNSVFGQTSTTSAMW